jgi:hypothetical protein
MDPHDQPESGRVKDWYLKVVAQTLTRMQENAGDFIRDCCQDPGGPRNKAGMLPRMFDAPILVFVTIVAVMVNPAFFTFAVAVPLTHMIAFFYGPAMRASFCANEELTEKNALDFFLHYSNATEIWGILCILVVSTLIVGVARKIVPAFHTPERVNRREPRPSTSRTYALGHALYGGLVRISLMLFMFACFISLLPVFERSIYSRQERHDLCHIYIQEQMALHTSTGSVPETWTCSDLYHGEAWFLAEEYAHFRDMHHPNSSLSTADAPRLMMPEKPLGPFGILAVCLGSVFLLGVILLPFVGPGIITAAICLIGPLILFIIVLKLGLVLVYFPITINQKNLDYFDQAESDPQKLVWLCFILSFFMLPFYEDCRAILHHYYRRCLSTNYFKEGKDTFLSKHYLKTNELFYCPFVMVTGTSSDFQPPGDTDLISELSFSPLHVGSEETSYVEAPPYNSLSKCAALTGAGCLDAISLTMTQTVSLRFWLEFLNLSWGDFVTFTPHRKQGVRSIRDRLQRTCQKTLGKRGYYKAANTLSRWLVRLPAMLVLLLIYGLWNVAVFYEQSGVGIRSCDNAETLFRIGNYMMAGAVLASFFYFVPVLHNMAISPFLRQVHQVSRYFYVGYEPPALLYITDGGVQDCTGIGQLLMRRCERILLVLAAFDNADDLDVLKMAIKVASDENWCSFYDPVDPRRDILDLLEAFKTNTDQLDIHIGIYYPTARSGKPQKTGHLFIVKNRLPAKMANQPIEPPLSHGEITGENGPSEWDEESWRGLTTDQLGHCGCCDCCHTRGCNCGPKFPGGSAHGYLFLTPKWFSSLARLSYEISSDAINKVTGARDLSSEWEQHVVVPPLQDDSLKA